MRLGISALALSVALSTSAMAEVVWVDCGPIAPFVHHHHSGVAHVYVHGRHVASYGHHHCRRVRVRLRRLCPVETAAGGGAQGEEFGDSGASPGFGDAASGLAGYGGGLGVWSLVDLPQDGLPALTPPIYVYRPPPCDYDPGPMPSSAAPEPPTWLLLALGLAFLAGIRWRRWAA